MMAMRPLGVIDAAAGLMAASVVLMGAASPAPSPAGSPGAPMTSEQWIAKYQTAWDALKTYQCTITSREYLNGRVQDRVYVIKVQKPTSVRLDIVGGDGKGSAAVWQGGDTVNGHQGGFLSIIHLNLNIHNKIATTMRGRTIAQASFGADLDEIKSIKWKSTDVTVAGERFTMTGVPQDPAQDDGIAKEVMTLGANGLPVELTEYDTAGMVARHEVYTDVQVDITLPDSTWHT